MIRGNYSLINFKSKFEMVNQKYINVKILPISPNFIEIGRILMLKIKLNVNESGTNWEKTSWAANTIMYVRP